MTIKKPQKNRKYFAQDFSVSDWTSLEPLFEQLLQEEPQGLAELETFLEKVSELEAITGEDRAWRYIQMTLDTANKEYADAFQYYIKEILPHLSVYSDKLNRKIVSHPAFKDLDPGKYITFTRSLQREIALFREENIPLATETESLGQQYSTLMGKMTIEHDGETLTLQQAGKLLQSQDRQLRKAVWEKITNRRLEDTEACEEIMDKMIQLRHQMAQNAGYETYTQYMFDNMMRFDYSLTDTHKFHEAVETVVTPIYQEFLEERREKLGLETLRPWDLAVDVSGANPLEPFSTGEELLDKSQQVLGNLGSELGGMLGHMRDIGFLDVESRVGKAPGGYNYPLAESGIPFIFMNAAGTQGDVTTLLHESGHAIHSIVTKDISLNSLKSTPSEVAELASMSMELMAMDHYDSYYPNREELIRAKKDQLKGCIMLFPWVATVDAFQQWMYNNPSHSRQERKEQFLALMRRFQGDVIDWSGLDDAKAYRWHRQLHIFEVPFYYIEYAIAQLGALAVWRNFKQDPQKGLQGYLKALKMGYTRPIPEIYEAAGIHFDFGVDYMREQIEFCLKEYKSL